MLHRRRAVVFSRKQDWEITLRGSIDNKLYALQFRDFSEFDVSSGAIIVPLTVDDTKLVTTWPESLRSRYVVYAPAKSVIELCDNKEAFNMWMMKRI